MIKIAPQSLIKKVLTCCGKKCNFKRYLAAFFIDYQIKSICPAALVKETWSIEQREGGVNTAEKQNVTFHSSSGYNNTM